MVLVHRNASHNQEHWRNWAPPPRLEKKRFREEWGQGGGFTGNFRATPAVLQATSFLSSSHRSFLGPHFLFRYPRSFFGPHLFFSANIGRFLDHNFSFQVRSVLFCATPFLFGLHRLYIIKVSNGLVKHTATEWTGCILMTYNNTPSFVHFR